MSTHLPRFFLDQRLDVGMDVVLPEKTAHHVRQVLRAKLGDLLVVFNGLGGEYTCSISNIKRNEVDVNILSADPVNRESSLNIMLGIGILKRDAMNTAIQKATELGVISITPVVTVNTSVTRKQFDKRSENWQQVIQSACEQSGRTMLPPLQDVHSFDEWIEQADGDVKLLASPLAKTGLEGIDLVPKSISVLIGPEGGFSPEEEQGALAAGFELVSMGSRILRAETAPAVFYH